MMSLRAVLPALAALAVLASGCAKENTASVQPYQICSMPDTCTFASKCDTQVIDTPILDLAGARSMWLVVEMHNQLKGNGDEETGRVNTHDAHFESYSLEYDRVVPGIDPAVLQNIASAGGRTQQLIPAEGVSVVGFDPLPVGVVNALAGNAPAYPDYDEIQVKVTFKGRYDDGSKWEAPFTIPVRLCVNCLSLACDDPAQVPISACPSMFQWPRGKIECTEPSVTCVTTGTFCGSDPNVMNGDPDVLYVCTTAGVAPANQTACPNGCDAVMNVCNP